VEDDKLVVTVSSRGAVAPAPITNNGEAGDEPKGRRGWGLKLIRTLMDEVEFERAGDGTRLRMAKYLRQ
jgi:anti-sigma regulatory factor (Ser/Thr protein kinase)